MKKRLVREILSLSYGGAFVDEYQDCSLDQHDLILGLAEILPCRIVGDPLQGIFDFGYNQIVDWDQHVYPLFTRLPNLPEPWRWKNTNPELGKWLTGTARLALEQKEPLPLGPVLQAGVCAWTQEVGGQYGPAIRIQVLMNALNHKATTFVICPPQPQYISLPHRLAGNLKNRYHSIEAITSQELHRFAESIEEQRGLERLHAVYDFVKECLINQQDLDAVLKAVETGGSVRTINRCTLRALAEQIVCEVSFIPVARLLEFVEKNVGPTVKRHQPWQEMRKALAEVISGGVPTLVEAAYLIRNRGAVKCDCTPSLVPL